MIAAPPGGGGVAAGSVSFPPLDLASLGSAGNWLKSQAAALSGSAGRFSGATKQVSNWTGKGADAWHGAVHTTHGALTTTSSKLGAAGGVLSGLCSELETLQAAYQQAAANEAATRQRIASRQAAMAQLLANPAPPGSLPSTPLALDPLGDYLDQQELSQAVSAEQQAVGQVHAAAHVAAGKLAGLAGRLPKLVHDGNVGGPPGPSHFLVMLLGSIVGDNYIRGRAFQEELNSRLNLPENTQSYTIEIRTKAGTLRTVTVKPDRMGGVVAEDKSGIYQYNSSQLQGEMALAKQEGVPFQLTVGPNTRISRPAQVGLDRLSTTPSQGGVPPVLRYQGNGIATNETGTQEYVVNLDTHTFEPMQVPVPGSEPTLVPGTSTGAIPLPSNGEPTGTPTPEPVDPIEPGIPIDPLLP